jgi:predicted PurR-regulated permease PerM
MRSAAPARRKSIPGGTEASTDRGETPQRERSRASTRGEEASASGQAQVASDLLMLDLTHDRGRLRRVALIAIAFGISVAFLWVISDFLIALLLAALAAGILRPWFNRLVARLNGRTNLAAGITIALLLVLGILPLAAFGTLVGVQAVELAKDVEPWVRHQLSGATPFTHLMERYPWLNTLSPYREQILGKLGEFGGAAVGMITTAATETMSFFLLLFVMLYATFSFLVDGRELLRKILYYLPLPPEDENRLVARFVSVARATMKGTLVIGLIQGALGGIAFYVAGIGGAAVWAAAMAALSIVPGLGTAVVWVPAVIYLFVIGRYGAGVGLLIWSAGVVGTVDNFLRPFLVGKDSKMSDLLVLISTLGGIVLFGAVGFIIGPIIAALFVTVWEIYGETFRDVLPEPAPLSIPPGGLPPASVPGENRNA